MKNLEKLAKYLADPIRKYVDKTIFPIIEKVKEIESKKINIKEIIDQIPIPKNGEKGDRGEPGKPGNNGIDGINGKNGLDGANGKSFIEQLPDLGFINKEEFIESLKGKDGNDGKDGHNGIDGKNGKDAIQITILPAIDESKHYDRGNYARHKSGLWRSFENTIGLRGWECIVDGIDHIEINQIDDRNFCLKLNKSSGNIVEKSFSMPVVIYRGVYKEGNKYTKGDTVTWGGSMWHCNQDTDVKPDNINHKHWTLSVKRGRDAK